MGGTYTSQSTERCWMQFGIPSYRRFAFVLPIALIGARLEMVVTLICDASRGKHSFRSWNGNFKITNGRRCSSSASSMRTLSRVLSSRIFRGHRTRRWSATRKTGHTSVSVRHHDYGCGGRGRQRIPDEESYTLGQQCETALHSSALQRC